MFFRVQITEYPTKSKVSNKHLPSQRECLSMWFYAIMSIFLFCHVWDVGLVLLERRTFQNPPSCHLPQIPLAGTGSHAVYLQGRLGKWFWGLSRLESGRGTQSARRNKNRVGVAEGNQQNLAAQSLYHSSVFSISQIVSGYAVSNKQNTKHIVLLSCLKCPNPPYWPYKVHTF
jgi:hypothetical protein